tara:strand:+ start:695 stop:934 length:240 start_codon:yes stop_codon:yes gene_type:complete
MSNPYQIRTDVMSMAKEMLDKAYDTQMTLAYTVMNQYKENSEQALDAWNKYVPKMYTPEELKKQAETLYEFVSNDKKSK